MKHTKSFGDFLNEKQEVVNEAIKPFTPEIQKELAMMFGPLIKYYGMEVKEIRPDGLLEDGTPTISVATYNVITGGTWTSAQFFNQKDAQACADMFNEKEVGCAAKSERSKEYAAVVRKDNMGKNLFFGELTELNNNAGTKLDMEAIRSKAKEGFTSLK